MSTRDPDTHLLAPLLADGRPLLTLGTLGLLFAGGFAVFLGLAGQFLPHDVQYLGMTAESLCHRNGCSIVHFMIHDRIAFGGVLISLSVMYLWLIHFPLAAREPWAWWTLFVSVAGGFCSFLTYLASGYLDTWHGTATLFLLPCFAIGLWRSYRTLPGRTVPWAALCRRGWATSISMLRATFSSRFTFGRTLMLGTSLALLVAGVTITCVGMTVVFVPEDLKYMETTAARLNELNPRLIPLIAHDRAGFGAGVLNLGLVLFLANFHASPSRHLRQALTLAGVIGFTAAIGVHPFVGYNNPVHLAPAVLAAVMYLAALLISLPLSSDQRTAVLLP